MEPGGQRNRWAKCVRWHWRPSWWKQLETRPLAAPCSHCSLTGRALTCFSFPGWKPSFSLARTKELKRRSLRSCCCHEPRSLWDCSGSQLSLVWMVPTYDPELTCCQVSELTWRRIENQKGKDKHPCVPWRPKETSPTLGVCPHSLLTGSLLWEPWPRAWFLPPGPRSQLMTQK